LTYINIIVIKKQVANCHRVRYFLKKEARMSSIVEKFAVVTVKNFVGKKGYAFFTSPEHGDVFVLEKELEACGFKRVVMVPGYSAVIDIIDVEGRQRVGTIHEINCQPGQSERQSKPRKQKKLPFHIGVWSTGEIKVVQQGYGFIKKPGYVDLFFPLAKVPSNLVPHLAPGVSVEFVVEDCDRGVLARITNIIWDESQVIRNQVDCDKERQLRVEQVTYPTGQNRLEVRDEKGELIAEPRTLVEARELIGKVIDPLVSTTHDQKSRRSQAMKGKSSSKRKAS
jgi:cold shock CspA family protein